MTDRPFLILGGGEYAAVVADLLLALGEPFAGYVLPEGETVLPSMTVAGGDAWLRDQPFDAYRMANGIGGVGDNRLRASLFAAAAGRPWPELVHPRAIVSPSATLGASAQVMAGAILQAGVWVGENAIINTGAIIDHHSRIGAHAHIAPGVTLSGEVTIGEGAHIGTGASVRQGVTIGAGAMVAAGAVVVANVAPCVRVAGVPARVVVAA